MRKCYLFFAVTLLVVLIATAAHSQPKHSMAMRLNWYDYDVPSDEKNVESNGTGTESSTIFEGLEVSYYNRILPNTFLAVPVKFGSARLGRDYENQVDGTRNTIGNLDLLLQHNFFAEKRISPYLHAGVGNSYNFDREIYDFNVPLGAGLNIRIARNLYLSGQAQYRLTPEEDDLPARDGLDCWHYAGGLHLFFGPKEEEVITPTIIAPPMPKDTDGDGLTDDTDRCPGVAGLAANGGCPDTDSDGVVDIDDRCPSDKGLANLRGCPDTDNDGISNLDDQCPTQAGPASNKGCPVIVDRDKDGVVDADDACPDVAGSAALKGCPDRDNDGIADRDDRCPSEAGPRSNGGCPEITKEEQARLETIVKNIQFNSAKSTLVPTSYPILDEVASLMQRYQGYNLSIEGHTDNAGDDAMNLRLSEERAKTCFDYLVGKGVSAGRMSYKGFGETKPVASNNTAEGRKQNRRVEFKLSN